MRRVAKDNQMQAIFHRHDTVQRLRRQKGDTESRSASSWAPISLSGFHVQGQYLLYQSKESITSPLFPL